MKAQADGNAEVYRLGQDEFQKLTTNQQFAQAVLRILASEVRAVRKCFDNRARKRGHRHLLYVGAVCPESPKDKILWPEVICLGSGR
jgi:hypothetical protein